MSRRQGQGDPTGDNGIRLASIDSDYLGQVLNQLSEREKGIILLRFHGALTLDELGATFGVTRERIRQIEWRALSKLRSSESISALVDELEGGSPVPSAALRAWADRADSIRGHPWPPIPEREEPTVCGFCEQTFWPTKWGRPRKYCSNACRQSAYRNRHRSTQRGVSPATVPPGTGLSGGQNYPDRRSHAGGGDTMVTQRNMRGFRVDAELVELAGTAGTTIVTLLATDAWEKTKTAVAGLWGKIHPQRADTIAAELAEAHAELLAAQAAGDTQTKQTLAGDWQRKLHQLLATNPAAAGELRRVLDDLAPAQPAGTQVWTGTVTMTATASENAQINQLGQGIQHITGR